MLHLRTTHGVHRGSVLPKVAVTRSRGTTILGTRVVSWLEIVVIAACVIALLANAYFAMHDDIDAGDRIHAGVSGIVVFILALGLLREYRRRAPLRWASMRLRGWPLRLGQDVNAELRGSLSASSISRVAATLQCDEVITIGSGRMATTKDAARYAIELAPAHIDLDRAHLTARWTFTIPPDQPPSFAVQSNAVRWRLLVRITTGEGAEVPADFDLLVLPEAVA